jgi:hypothetical protein
LAAPAQAGTARYYSGSDVDQIVEKLHRGGRGREDALLRVRRGEEDELHLPHRPVPDQTTEFTGSVKVLCTFSL